MGKRVTRQFLANIGFCTFIMYTSTCVFTYIHGGVLKGEEKEGVFNLPLSKFLNLEKNVLFTIFIQFERYITNVIQRYTSNCRSVLVNINTVIIIIGVRLKRCLLSDFGIK